MAVDAAQRAELWRRYCEGDPEGESAFLEMVRKSYENVGRGDLAAAMEVFDEEALFVPAAQAPESEPVRGHAGIRDFYDGFLAVWDVTLVPEEVHRAGESIVVVVGIELVSRSGGVPLKQRTGDVLTFNDDGLVTRWQIFVDPEEAKAAAGLTA